MSFGTDGLTFNVLRGANKARLPEFKNSKGGPAHSREDGSDWSPAQWLQAVLGELGEFARVRCQFEAGDIGLAVYKERAAKELADVVTYLDILARHSLDELDVYDVFDGRTVQGSPIEPSPAQSLMQLVATLGEYANDRKKYERGDYNLSEFGKKLEAVPAEIASDLNELFDKARSDLNPHPGDFVMKADKNGVDLGQSTMDKFNEVSERVGSRVYVDAADWHLRKVK